MKRILKYIFFILLAIILLVGIGIYILFQVIDTEDIKQQISAQFYIHTGRELLIDGDVELSFYPEINARVTNITVGNSAEYGTNSFIELEEARLGVALLPLLHREVRIKNILLINPTIQLVTLENGDSNWLDWHDNDSTNTKNKQATTLSALGNKQPEERNVVDVRIQQVDLQDADITWLDKNTNKTITVNNLTLNMRDFALYTTEHNTTRITLHGNLQLDQLNFNDAKQHMVINNIKLEDFDLTQMTNETRLDGELSFDKLSFFAADEPLAVLELAKLRLNNFSWEPASLTDSAPVIFTTTRGAAIDLHRLREFTINSKLIISKAHIKQFNLSNIKAELDIDDGIVELKPLSAQLYQGFYQGLVRLNVQQAKPIITTEQHISGLNLGQLTTKFDHKVSIDGQLNANLKLIAAGNNVTQLKRDVDGSAELNVEKGNVRGINFGDMIQAGLSLLSSGRTETSPPSNDTAFDKLSATATINDGLVRSNNLLLITPILQTTGQAQVNLINDALRADLIAVGVQTARDSAGQLHVTPVTLDIPIKCDGIITSPKCSIDTEKLLASIGNELLGNAEETIIGEFPQNVDDIPDLLDKLGDNLEDTLRGILGGGRKN